VGLIENHIRARLCASVVELFGGVTPLTVFFLDPKSPILFAFIRVHSRFQTEMPDVGLALGDGPRRR
jgi:hypothetical protein